MNRGELLDMVKNKGWSSGSDVSALDEIISLYPWFQSVYTLKLDAHFSSDSVTFDDVLKRNAVYIANREVLYYILKDSSTDIETKEKPESDQAIKNDDVGSESKSSTENGLRSRSELVSEIEARLAEIKGVDDKAGAVSEKTENPKTELPATEVAESKKSTDILLIDEEFDYSTEEDKEEVLIVSTKGADLLDLDYSVTERSVTDLLTIDEETELPSADDLVDRFIKSNPRIEPNREKFPDQQENIAEYVEDNSPGLITETLAKIYVNQKFYTRAIMIYEKLSLKIPEKSSYFATQIEKIKELMS